VQNETVLRRGPDPLFSSLDFDGGVSWPDSGCLEALCADVQQLRCVDQEGSGRLRPSVAASASTSRKRPTMKTMRAAVLIGVLTAMAAVPVIGQIHKFYSPGTVWTVTMIKMASGMDQTYLQYLDSQFKKGEEAQIKAGFQKSYKILRTLDDGGAWNLLILREYTSLASIESNEEKSDALLQQTDGNDQAQMQGYQDRSKYREVVGTKYARELILK
jgi:hypothetical protein